MATKNLLVRGGADFSQLKKAMVSAQQSIKSFKDSVSRSMESINLAIAGLGAGLGIGMAVKDAMTFEASIQQLNRLMGQSSLEFLKWANSSAVAFNMSKSEAVKYGATFANIISTFSQNSQQTQQYTQDLLKATAVAASMTGRTMEDALERIRSGMLGNTEAVEDLGIFVNVAMIESTKAFQQFANGKSWDQLDFRTQQSIRYFAILEQAATKYGVEVGNNSISATAQFVAQLNNLKLAIGQAFLPIWQTVLPALTNFVAWLTRGMNVVAQFMTVLFGKEPMKNAQSQAAANQQVASSASAVGDAYKKAGKEAKKAKGALAGFDEVNQLAEKDSDASDESGGDGGEAPGTGTAIPIEIDSSIGEVAEGIASKVRGVAEAVKGFFGNLKGFITEHKDIIISALGGIGAGLITYGIAVRGAGTATLIWSGIVKACTLLTNGLKAAMMFLISPVGLIVAAVAALTAAFIYFYRTNETFRDFVNNILDKIKVAAVTLWEKVLVPFGQWLADVFVAAWDKVKVGMEWLWKNVLVPMGSFLSTVFKVAWETIKNAIDTLLKDSATPLSEFFKTFWKDVIVPLGAVLKDVFAVAFKTVGEVAKSLWINVLVPLGVFIKTNFQPTVEALSAVFKFLWQNILKPLGTFLGVAFLGNWKRIIEVIQFLWEKVLSPLVPFLKEQVNKAFVMIGETIENLKTIFNGITKFITGVFTGDWGKAWEGVKTIFKGVFDQLYDIVKRPLNLIIDAINEVIGGLNKISFDLPDWIPGVGGKKFGINIPNIPHLAKGGITNGPTLAMIGDNPGGREVVSPLDDLQNIIASAVGSAVLSAMQFSNNGNNNQSGDVTLNIDGRTIARVIKPYLDQENRRIGNDIKLNPI